MTFRALSWGVGRQSTTIAAMSALGELPPLDAVIFADTQWERKATYASLSWWARWLDDHDVRVETVTVGNIRVLAATDHINIPFWTDDSGLLQRQCTGHFKVIPVRRKIRQLMGFDERKPPHPKPGSVELYLGIGFEEWERMSDSPVKFINHVYPLVDNNLTTQDCEDWLVSKGLPIPHKSACIGCPFHSASEWLSMKAEAPDEFADAVAFDEENRSNPLKRWGKSTANKLYVWKGHEPLASADLATEARKERTSKQLPLICGAYCMS